MNNQVDIEDAVGKTIVYTEKNDATILLVYSDKTFSIVKAGFVYDDLVLEDDAFYFEEWDEEMLLEHRVISQEWLDRYNQSLEDEEKKRVSVRLEQERQQYEQLKKKFGYT